MFEINITNDLKSPFSAAAEKWNGYDAGRHETYSFSSSHIHIRCLRYKEEKDDVFENESFVVIRCGQVFYRLTYREVLNPLSASDLYKAYLGQGLFFLDNIKGNFIIVIHDKTANKLFLAKDKLGLKYAYYTVKNNLFYVSTNLNDFKRVEYAYDFNAITQHLIFSYPIANKTFIRDVSFLETGAVLCCEKNSILMKSYSSVDNLFPAKGKVAGFQKERFISLFRKAVLQRAAVTEKPNVSLTGGFDGRAVTAVFLNEKLSFKTYSFGMRGGENTEVPLAVSRRIGFEHKPICLDQRFEEGYGSCALDAIYFSDGISRFERANYIYAMKQLAPESFINITGLIGGEVFGAVHLKTDYVNEAYFDLFYSGLFDTDRLTISLKNKGCLSGIIAETMTSSAFMESLQRKKQMIHKWRTDPSPWLFYLKDLISTGFQRFYGNQMHLERYYCDNLTPFYDYDVLEYLFGTDYINIYKNAFKSSPFYRIKNRHLQSIIIKSQYKELGELPVDRGYPSNYNLDARKILIPYCFLKRRKSLKGQRPDFNSPYWSTLMFQELVNHPDLYGSSLIDAEVVNDFVAKYQLDQYDPEFNQIVSLSIWLSGEKAAYE